jgi:LacI family transcriptional regulator
VLIDRLFPKLKVNYVGVNNYGAAFTATQHLLKAGYKNPGMIGFQTSLPNLSDRKRGFISALEDHGKIVNQNNILEVSLETSKEEVETAIDQLLSLPTPVDALFFASNKISTLGLKYINRLPLTVPKDLALYSFDESDATELFYASLTHIRQPLYQIGQEAVKMLLQVISGGNKTEQLQLDAELVIGQSTKRKTGK